MQPPPPPRLNAHCLHKHIHGEGRGGGVELETMPLNTSWGKFQLDDKYALASSFLYVLNPSAQYL
jgi:hypothetical protein